MFSQILILGVGLVLVQSSPVPEPSQYHQGRQNEPSSFTARVLPKPEYTDWHNETRQRDKAMRLKAIQLSILELLGRSNKSPTLSPVPETEVLLSEGAVPNESTPNETTIHHRPNNAFPGQLDSFQASCDLPTKVDEDIWIQPGFYRIYFNLSSLQEQNKNLRQGEEQTGWRPREGQRNQVMRSIFPSRRSYGGAQDSTNPTVPITPQPTIQKKIIVISANLRLYKIGRGPNAEPPNFVLPKSSQFCNNTNEEIAANQHQRHLLQPTSSILSMNPAQLDEKIFVKIYWFTVPVSKHHNKKKLLYSRTLLVKESGWVDFDIQKAVRTWLDSKINYGLSIEVENEDNELVDVGTYFSNVECPLTNGTEKSSTRVRETTYAGIPQRTHLTGRVRYPAPILELCTLTLPLSIGGDMGRRPVSYQLSRGIEEVKHLGRSADSGISIESQGKEQRWQRNGFFLTTSTTPQPYFHRHRHHHGSFSVRNHRREFGSMQGDSPIIPTPETTTKFSLDPDHPFNFIMATARTFLSREKMYDRRRKHGWGSWSSRHHRVTDEIPESGEETLRFQPIIVEAENVVIENNSSRDQGRKR